MRILVLSDLHRRRSNFEKAVEAQPDAKHVLFLGDGVDDAEELASFYPDKTFYLLSGNCDFSSKFPSTLRLKLGGVNILATHGHLFNVKTDTSRLFESAKNEDIKIALYGHTHIPKVEYKDGIYLVCPGALGASFGNAGYAVIDITDSGIMPVLIKL